MKYPKHKVLKTPQRTCLMRYSDLSLKETLPKTLYFLTLWGASPEMAKLYSIADSIETKFKHSVVSKINTFVII